MGSLLNFILSCFGFGVGIILGLLIGYFLFIYWQPLHVKELIVRPLTELDSKFIRNLLPEIPLWVKNPDYDRIDWINKFLYDMWPYLDKAICKIIRDKTKPLIDQYCAKFKIKSIEFESITLGTLPPCLQGVKAYDTQENEMIIEPVLKWAGSPNIVITVKAFAMKATVQLVDLQVFATVRAIFKPLVPSFPCFSKILFSLMEKPHVDFGLKLIGGDLMAIPGLHGLMQDFIKEQIANLYLWPKTLEVAILNDDKETIKRPAGMLHVKVINAKKLKKADLIGKSDPYVKLSLGEGTYSTKKTSVKMNTLNPEWNESFTLVVQDPESQALEIHIYDWDKISSHDKLGMQVIPLHILTPEETKLCTLEVLKNMDPNDPSNQKFRGQVTLELTYKPFKEEDKIYGEEKGSRKVDCTSKGEGLLVVIVHEAEDLEGKHHTNPYVRLLLRGEERKTKPVKRNRDPRWNAEFEFVLDEPPVNDTLKVEVISKATGLNLHFRELLGYLSLNLSDAVINKRINERYQLIDSKNGKIHIELQWIQS